MVLRHAGVLSALLLTAALLCAMPGLCRMPAQDGRADPSLRPAPLRTLTVWLMPGDVGDRKLISQLCSAFEKEQKGVRVFLRVVTAEEFTAENAVLPDAALFETGDIAVPEDLFVPLQEGHPSGSFAGVSYAVPLWLAPNVLSLPQAWLSTDGADAPVQNSLLASATAQPPQEKSALVSSAELPWEILTLPGAVEAPEGVGLLQLLSICPSELRARLVAGAEGLKAQTPAPTEPLVTTLPKNAALTPPPDLSVPARLETLSQYRQRLQKGEKLCVHVPETAVSQHVRYAALCADSEDARAFLRFLREQRAMAAEHSLIPTGADHLPGDAVMLALIRRYQSAALPNAFAHTKQELAQWCHQSFARCENPQEALIRLR